MTDDPPQDLPSQRALGAMESAVRRARASGQAATSPTDPGPPRPARPAAPRWVPPNRPAAGQGRDRWLMASVVVVAALVLAGGIALAYSLGGGSQSTATSSSTVPTTAHAGAARHPSSRHAGSPSGSASSSTTTTTTPVVPGAAPVISALTPSTGAPGQAVQIAGSNFLSPDGRIVATFNGQVTSTSCPAPNTCMVTVPPSSGARSAQVTITTASGTSNAETFRYS
jgi:hypothetical protein